MSCENIPSLLGLQNTKKHADDFGRLMGTGTGTSTNGVTGQVRPTYNKVINDMWGDFNQHISGMTFARVGTFKSGATLDNTRETLLWDVSDGGDGHEYGWTGTFQKEVLPNSTPSSTGGIGPGAWVDRSDVTLRSELAAPGGAGLVCIKAPFTNSVLRVLSDASLEKLSVKHWGAKGDGVTDDTAAISAACNDLQAAYAANGVLRTLVFPDGTYRTSGSIVVHGYMCIECSGLVIFQNAGKDKTFRAVELQGGGKKSTLGVIKGYGTGILIRGSTHNVEFQNISDCVDAVVFRADKNWPPTSKNLDNVVRGIHIGNCTNGIVFDQNADKLVQQGNEVRVNFISETPTSVLFRTFDNFTHTVFSNWDSNFIELIASDPLTAPDASMIRNSTNQPVQNITYSIRSWCGGWEPDAGTMCLIRGKFATSSFSFSLAQRPGLDEVVDPNGKQSFGSCSFNVPRYANLGNPNDFHQAVTANSEFNGGVALYRSKFRIRVSVPDLTPGQTFASSFWHVVAQVSGVGRVRIEQYSDPARGKYLIEARDAGNETKGMVRLWITNISTATVTSRNIDLIISAF